MCPDPLTPLSSVSSSLLVTVMCSSLQLIFYLQPSLTLLGRWAACTPVSLCAFWLCEAFCYTEIFFLLTTFYYSKSHTRQEWRACPGCLCWSEGDRQQWVTWTLSSFLSKDLLSTPKHCFVKKEKDGRKCTVLNIFFPPTVFYYVAQARLEFMVVLLPQPPECWNCKCELPHLLKWWVEFDDSRQARPSHFTMVLFLQHRFGIPGPQTELGRHSTLGVYRLCLTQELPKCCSEDRMKTRWRAEV